MCVWGGGAALCESRKSYKGKLWAADRIEVRGFLNNAVGFSERGLGRHPPLVPVPRIRGGSQLRFPALLLLRRETPGRHKEDPDPGPGPCTLRFSLSSSMAPVKSHLALLSEL